MSERAEKRGLQQKMFEKQQNERAHMQKFVDRFKAQASKARQAQSRIKALERMDLGLTSLPTEPFSLNFRIEEIPSPMLSLSEVDIGYEEGNQF